MTNVTADARGVGWDLYYGWVVLGVAALAMVGTLPGRTQGLGLITEPLLRDLGVDRVQFAEINFVATLVGSLFCFGIGGWSIATAAASSSPRCAAARRRRHGVQPGPRRGHAARADHADARPRAERAVGGQPGDAGQMVPRRLTWAMGVYALVMSVGFMLAFPAVGALVQARGWRVAWAAVGVALIVGLAPLAWAAGAAGARDEPASWRSTTPVRPTRATDATLAAALRSPAFWVFGIASSLYGLAAPASACSTSRSSPSADFHPTLLHALAVTAITGLAGNFIAGAWADRGSLRRVLVAALLLLTGGAGRAAARHDLRARDGAGGGDGHRGRLRDGRVLQLLGQGLRPAISDGFRAWRRP